VLAPTDGDSDLTCGGCAACYPRRFGIPILLPPKSESVSLEEGSIPTHKEQQAAFFDQDPRDEFGVTRPRGAPALYGWLLREKFRRSIIGLEDVLQGATALTICGGSGLDAEFLARAGARVILSDISLGVVLQARERTKRYGLDISLVVADAEALPFRDESIDVVYVHDGLHHLERPSLALAEMARVSRRAVSVSEPARALATAAAVRVGLAEAQEEAGNPVRRLTLDEIVSQLAEHGFRPVLPHRYAMYYRHWPGRAVRLLSTPSLLPLATGGFRVLNSVLGRYGNKLAVQAVRLGH
jgi:ubiquinone/menaquinone biosynthesis C-methylase UbiE